MNEPTTKVTNILVTLDGRTVAVEATREGRYGIGTSLPYIEDRLSRLADRPQPRSFNHEYATQEEAVEAAKKLLSIVNAHAAALFKLQNKLAEDLKAVRETLEKPIDD